MDKFSAEAFYKIGCLLGNTIQALGILEREGHLAVPGLTPPTFSVWLIEIGRLCRSISLKQSAKFADGILESLKGGDVDPGDTKIRVEGLQRIIFGEMEEALFLWVPPHRVEFYARDAEALVGSTCCKRFPSIRREVQEAVKCYAVGRYTASAFHMARSTEAGMHGLAKAIKFVPPNNNWNLVFRELGNQFKLPADKRPKHWKTHGDFLETAWADLRAVSKAWRNNIAHLVDTYTEEKAKEFVAIIPIFLRDLAKKMDEKGKLY